VAASHYETLGVAAGADPDEVRRAYLDLARRLHPDRWLDASGDERAEADRRMREVNEAWRVLGNPGRRLAYDAGRRRSPVGAAGPTSSAGHFSSGDLFVDGEAPPDLVTKVIRFLPWAAVLVALAGIFVFTAYATSSGDGEASCVATDGASASAVDCEQDGARRVVLRVADVGLCPAGTEPFLPAGEDLALCLQG
jgi:curved DNA-binding protein CbpA